MPSAVALPLDAPSPRPPQFQEQGRHEARLEPAEHIVVIAGPSGSGKSTLMVEFVAGRLAEPIASAIPAAAKTWLRATANEVGSILRTPRAGGVVLHYDTMRAHTRGYQHFSNDPAMQAVVLAGVPLTIVTVIPPREVLFEQFLRRARNGEFEEWDRKPVIAPLKQKVTRAFNRIAGRSPRLLKECHFPLLEVYASDEAFGYWTRRWELFLDHVRSGRDDVRLIYIAPERANKEHPRFQLLRIEP